MMLGTGDGPGSELFDFHVAMSPVRIEFELTEACNLECRFCYNSRVPAFVSLADARAILETLASQGVLEMVLTGGEPMLHPDFEQIVGLACRLFCNVFVQTNGTMLTASLAHYLKDIGVAGINISLHGNAIAHDALTMKEGSHVQAAEGIRHALDSSLVTWVNTVLTSVNRTCIAEHLRTLNDLGVRSYTFTRFTPTGSGRAEHGLALSPDELIDVLLVIKRFVAENPGTASLLANALPRCALPPELAYFSEPCSYGISRYYVDARGVLMICGMSRIGLGSVLRNSISDLRRNSREVRGLCSRDAYPSSCRSCGVFEQCRGGCRAAALAATERLDGLDPMACVANNRGLSEHA